MPIQKRADVSFPTYGQQSPKWWVPMMRNIREWTAQGLVNHIIMSSSALPATSNNIAISSIDPYAIGNSLTSHNRNRLVVQSDADYIFFIDHDTVPPVDALQKLIALDVPMAAGVYFHKGGRHEPIAYMSARDGLYTPLHEYYPGEIVEVDAVGMGCTLIRRDVFAAIRERNAWFMLSDGSTMLVDKEDIEDRQLPSRFRTEGRKIAGDSDGYYMVEKVKRVSAEDEDRFDYPYFTMAHGRTEDMGFCELVKRAGFPILLDTSIECEHIGENSVTVQDFMNERFGAVG